MKKIFNFLVLFLFIVGGVFLIAKVSLAAVPTPQIYQVVPSQDNSMRPWVIGWTPNEVEVEVLMDGESVGMAKVVKDESGTASFGWAPAKDIPVGWHKFSVRGKYGENFSETGGILGYQIEQSMSAPTVVEPEQYEDYVLIKGLVINNSSVKIYIDGILRADFLVPNHPSGTTNFWFKARGLLNGEHKVYAVAYDEKGKLSKHSNAQDFNTEFQKITKGETDPPEQTAAQVEVLTEPKSEEVVEVVNEPIANQAVKVVDVVAEKISDNNDAAENNIEIESQELATEMKILETDLEKINQGAEETISEEIGEVSSAEEVSERVNEEKVNENEENAMAKEKQNRFIGIVLLMVIALALVVWYAWERKREQENKENKEEKPTSGQDDSIDQALPPDDISYEEVDKADDEVDFDEPLQ